MKRRLVVLGVLVGVGVGAVLGAVQAKPLAPGVKVGVMVSASGPLYFAGGFQRAGCELVKEEINVSCFYADAGDTEAEAKAAMRILQAKNVEVLIAPIDSESVKRITKLNQASPLPIIAPSSLTEGISAKYNDKNWLFRTATTTSQDTSSLAAYIAAMKPDSVAILTGPENYSKQNAKMLQFGLVMRDVSNIQQYSLTEIKTAMNSQPEVVVLMSMESSIDFLNGLSSWFGKIPAKFLVAGNLANYSMYSWSKDLQGAKALLPRDEIPSGFREDVADYLKRPNLLGNPNSPMFGLAWRTYQTVRLAGLLQNDRRLALERMKQSFTPTGYYIGQKYTVYAYGSNGTFTEAGSYQPDTP